jgi:hypothetical protein
MLAVLAVAMGVALAGVAASPAIAVPPPATTIESQTDRRPPSPLIHEAWRSRPVVELFRSGERNFVPDPDIVGDVVAPPQTRPAPVPVRPVPVRPVPAAPRPGVGVVASLLLGLVGGVVGGCAALAGWTAATRRRPRQPASVT